MPRTDRRPWIYPVITHVLVAVLSGLITWRVGTSIMPSWAHSWLGQIQSSLPTITSKDGGGAKGLDFGIVWDVWGRLESSYYDPKKIDPQTMIYGAAAGIAQALGDPYTTFLPPETKQRLTEDLQGEFDGVGIQLGYRNQQLAVVAPLKDHPAEKAGIKAGDYILRITDKNRNIDRETSGISLDEAVTLIRGPRGSTVTLSMLTEGEEPREIELVRQTIEVPSVELEMFEQDKESIAIVTISRFGEKTNTEWETAVSTILREDPAGIILDLRNNPGGYLESSVDLASDLIDGGLIVSQKGRSTTQDYKATRKARLSNYEIEVLVNKGSASASEILAGALRDRRGAKLIGEQTFGKGTVQDAQQLPGGAGLNVTIGRWLLPSGQSIQDEGLPVDIEILDDPETLEIDEARERAILTLLENGK